MKVYIIFIFSVFSYDNQLNAQKSLTTAEKVNDFQFLYGELKASYPYFGINERLNGINWLAKQDTFINALSSTRDNVEFLSTLKSILNELNNGHTDMYPTLFYSYFYKAYKSAYQIDSSYKPYVDELEKSSHEQAAYWMNIHKDLNSNDTTNYSYNQGADEENVSAVFIDSISAAVITIKSFSYDLIEYDIHSLEGFFTEVNEYQNIIIDIQDNSGGDTDYWMKHVIPYLIEDTLSFEIKYAFKNSDRLRLFKPDYFENAFDSIASNLSELPEELDSNYYFKKEIIDIYPKANTKYLGDIYLLVNHNVYSSSELLAYFFKATSFGKVVGEQTGGDGIGTDPIILALPNSGIIIRFTGEMGLNPNGSANEEKKTVPDIWLETTSRSEARRLLLERISSLD